jgi:hypothetical protein
MPSLSISGRQEPVGAISNVAVLDVRKETDSLGEVDVPSNMPEVQNH